MNEIDRLDEPVVVSRRALTMALSWHSMMKFPKDYDQRAEAEIRDAFDNTIWCVCGHSEAHHYQDGYCGAKECHCADATWVNEGEDRDAADEALVHDYNAAYAEDLYGRGPAADRYAESERAKAAELRAALPEDLD